jgi:hypothetical protein
MVKSRLLEKPVKLFVVVAAVWLVGYAVAPIERKDYVSAKAIALFVVSSVTFVAGLSVSAKNGQSSRAKRNYSINRSLLTLRVVQSISAAGLALSYIDRYLIRKAPLTFDAIAVREVVSNVSVGVIGTVGAFLASFAPFLPLVQRLAQLRGKQQIDIATSIVTTVIVLLYIMFYLALGSRSIPAVVLLIVAYGSLWERRQSGKMGIISSAFTITLVACAMLVILIAVMSVRLEQMGMDPVESIQYSGYAEIVAPNDYILGLLSSGGLFSGILAVCFSIVQYVFHGFFEFSLLVQNFRDTHTGGRALLWLPIKTLAILGIPVKMLDYTTLIGVRQGVFTTFLGPLFVDFGFAMPLATLLIGTAIGMPFKRLRNGSLQYLPLCAILFCVLLFYPIFSLIDSAAGAYLIVTGSLLGYFLSPREKSKG